MGIAVKRFREENFRVRPLKNGGLAWGFGDSIPTHPRNPNDYLPPSARDRHFPPVECNSASADGEQNMKKVKELIQDIKKNWWIGGLGDWMIDEPCRTCRACRGLDDRGGEA